MTPPSRSNIRWLMLGLVTLGTVLNYLTRASLSVAAPTLKDTLAITTQQYSWIVIAFQATYAAMQPVAGFVLDKLGTRLGLALFAVAWSFAAAFHAFADGWRGLALARGLLGVSEAAGVPAGIRVVSTWFSPEQRSIAIGWFTMSSAGNIIAPPFVTACILYWGWQSAFVITGILSLVWAAWWYAAYRDPADHPRLTAVERAELLASQRSEAKRARKRSSRPGSTSCARASSGRWRRRASSPSRPGRRSISSFRSISSRHGTSTCAISRCGRGCRSSAPMPACSRGGICRRTWFGMLDFRCWRRARSSRCSVRSA